MTATNGWPGKPGWPLNPEKDKWHWVENKFTGDRRAALWLTDLHWGLRVPTHEMAEACIYLGPVLTPDEEQNLRDDLASAERERAHQHGRADRSAAEHAREQAKREALQKRCEEAEKTALQAAECHAREMRRADALQKRVAGLEAENAAFRNNKTEEEALREMMRDPRYWRHRVPEWVNKVRDGFRKLIGGKDG